MRYAVSVPPGGAAQDLVAMARACEDAGGDGFFRWDHLYIADGWEIHVPWVVLGAAAPVTPTDLLRVRTLLGPAADIAVPLIPDTDPALYEAAGATWLIAGPDTPDDWQSRIRTTIAAGPPT
jgi:hypothetical protein